MRQTYEGWVIYGKSDSPIQTKAFSDVWMKGFEIKAWEPEPTDG